jgi:hypothetical protein
MAEAHGVLPAVMANLHRLDREGCRLLPDSPEGGASRTSLRDVLSDGFGGELLARAARALAIRSQAAEIGEEFSAGGIPATVLKGLDFADRLYADPSLRGFGDLDILTPRSSLAPAEAVLVRLGYARNEPGMKHDADYGQLRYVRPGAAGAVELHWNLVNSPKLRAALSVSYEDVDFLPPSAENGWSLPSPASLLLIAAVHAAVSHEMDNLQSLCDVCQAARAAAGPIDTTRLTEAIHRTGTGLAVAAALDTAGRLFREPKCSQLAAEVGLRRHGVWRVLITPGVVARRHAYMDSFRRKCFRELLRRNR